MRVQLEPQGDRQIGFKFLETKKPTFEYTFPTEEQCEEFAKFSTCADINQLADLPAFPRHMFLRLPRRRTREGGVEILYGCAHSVDDRRLPTLMLCDVVRKRAGKTLFEYNTHSDHPLAASKYCRLATRGQRLIDSSDRTQSRDQILLGAKEAGKGYA
jgi:hypothetical protein